MIWVDVTSSCKSPLNTGVQRVVRSLTRELAALRPAGVTPLVWDNQLGAYARLGPREQRFLDNAFAESARATAEPERRANRSPLSRLVRHLGHRLRRLDLRAALRPGDVFFCPEIFQDRRTEFLPLLARSGRGHCAAIFHDAITLRRPDLSPPRRESGFAPYVEALAALQEVTAVSEFSRADLAALWAERGTASRAQLRAHPLGIDLERPRPPASSGSASRCVLCVSTIEPRKHHLGLLAAAESLWAAGAVFELELIGRSTNYWGARVCGEIERLQAAGRSVRWLQHVSDLELEAAYARARCTVFPSLIEGFGLPVLESLWHGRACVCADFGAMAEVAAGGGCLTCDVRSVEALAATLGRLLRDDALLQACETAAQARTFQGWRGFAEDLLRGWPGGG
ncbi:MAG: glycosyltransferase family 4 protein [Verrucomicrobia bacterium]|nr:glycosyltransferase family 4 protein [Verrucomicrobiota bacterium]